MTAALRSLFESLSRAGDPAVVFVRLATDLRDSAAARGAIDGASLDHALVAISCRSSSHQLLIDLHQLGVVDDHGRLDPERAEAVRMALELVGQSFGFARPADVWHPVATIPERYWHRSGLPAVRQTAGIVLEIIESASQTVRIAVPYVDDPAVGWLRDPLTRCRERGVRACQLITEAV
jgi:hypothetical protein